MTYNAEQHRKGRILKAAQQAHRPKISVKELASRIEGVSPRQIGYMYSGETWNDGTAQLILKELGLTDDIFGDAPEPSPEDVALADAQLWAEFPNDVKMLLLVYGKWLSGFDVQRRFTEAHALAEHMRDRQSNG